MQNSDNADPYQQIEQIKQLKNQRIHSEKNQYNFRVWKENLLLFKMRLSKNTSVHMFRESIQQIWGLLERKF
jgi:hypothetical protein